MIALILAAAVATATPTATPWPVENSVAARPTIPTIRVDERVAVWACLDTEKCWTNRSLLEDIHEMRIAIEVLKASCGRRD